MPRELDRFREYVEYVESNKWKCQFCGNKYGGSVTRIRAHLAGIPRYGIKGCEKVDHHVRAEALQKIEGKGSALDISTGHASGEGTERIVFVASQIVIQSDDASNPNDAQNSNQPWCAPQQPSCYWPTGTGTASACPRDQVSLPPGEMPLDNLDTSQQPDLLNHRLDAAHGNEIASSLQQIPMDLSASPSLDFTELAALLEQPTHLESEREQQGSRGLSSFPNEQFLGNSMSNGQQVIIRDGITPDSLLHSTNWSNNHRSLLENLPESRDEIVNTNLTVLSPLQIDSFLDVDGANRWQDCGQPCVVEVDPVRSNTSPTDNVQHPSQLPPRCDKEEGNDIRQFPSRTPMDEDPSIASQHTSVLDLLDQTVSTNAMGPSSSHCVSGLIYISTMVPLDPYISLDCYIEI